MNITRFDFHFHPELAQILLELRGSYSAGNQGPVPVLVGSDHHHVWQMLTAHVHTQLTTRGHLVGDLGPKTLTRDLQPYFNLQVDCSHCSFHFDGGAKVILEFSWGPGECISVADMLNLEVLANLPVRNFFQYLVDQAVVERQDFVGRHNFLGGRRFRRLAQSRDFRHQMVDRTNTAPWFGDALTLSPGITAQEIAARIEASQAVTAETLAEVMGDPFPEAGTVESALTPTLTQTIPYLPNRGPSRRHIGTVSTTAAQGIAEWQREPAMHYDAVIDNLCLRPREAKQLRKDVTWPAESILAAAKEAKACDLPPLLWSYLDIRPDHPLEPAPLPAERFDYLFDP